MRIVCPSCSATYEVPDSRMTAGRAVRCARCGGNWVPVPPEAASPEAEVPPEVQPPEPPPEAEAPAPPEPAQPAPPSPGGADALRSMVTVSRSAMARLAAHPAMPRSSTALRLAWAASIVVLVLLVAMAFAWRSQIVAAWPPSARAYAAFGLHPEASPGK